MDRAELQRLRALADQAGQAQLAQNTAMSQMPKTQGRGGILSSLISEAGGIGGAAKGAALGSAFGPLGTLLGAGVGGFLGGTVGRVAENKVRDDRIGLGDALKEGAVTGVLSAGPLKLAKLGKSTASGVKAGMGLKEALQVGGKEAANFSLLKKAGQKVAEEGDTLLTKSFRFTPSQLNNFKTKFGEDATKVIKRYGVTSADDFATKALDPLKSQFDEIVTKVGSVPRSTVESALKAKYQPLLKSAVTDNVAAGKSLKSQAQTILKKYGDTIDAGELNSLRKEFDSLVNYTEKAANPARYNVNKRAADALRTALQESAASKGMPLKEVGRELQKVLQLSENAAKQSNLGRGSLPLSLPNLIGGGVGAGAFGGPAGALGGAAATMVGNSNAGRRAIAKGTEKIAGFLEKGGANQFGVRNIAARTLPAKGLEAALTSRDYLSSNNIDNTTMAPTSINAPTNANIPQDYTNIDNMSSSSPFDPANVESNIEQILANGGTQKDLTEYLNTVKTIQAIKQAAAPTTKSEKPLSQGQQERKDLIDAIGMAEDVVAGGSINYGPIGSRVEGLKSIFNAADPETLNFKNVVSGLRAAITKARAGASLTAGELKLLSKYTPSDTDSQQQVVSKLQALRQLYGYNAPTGGATTLEDIIASYGQ